MNGSGKNITPQIQAVGIVVGIKRPDSDQELKELGIGDATCEKCTYELYPNYPLALCETCNFNPKHASRQIETR